MIKILSDNLETNNLHNGLKSYEKRINKKTEDIVKLTYCLSDLDIISVLISNIYNICF